jgi:hypothetical protein
MAKQFDYLVNDELDLVISPNGDLVKGECTLQNQHKILALQKGELKHAPLVGVGVVNWLLDDEADLLTLKKEITTQLELDNQVIRKLDTSNLPNIKLEAEYVS